MTTDSSGRRERRSAWPGDFGFGARLAVLGALVFSVSSVEAASTEVVSRSFSFARTNWSDAVELPLFDSAMGSLQSITFELSGTVGGSMRYESLDDSARTITMRLQAQISVGAPWGLTGVSELIGIAPLIEIVEEASADDGLIDFAGSAGSSFSGLNQFEDLVTTYDASNPLWEFSIREFFTTDSPGSTVMLPVAATSLSSGSGADTLATILQTSSGGDLIIAYHYDPATIPEPGALSLLGLACLLMSRARHRR